MGLRSRAGKMGAIGGVGFGVLDGALTFYDRRQSNPEESVATSATVAAGTAAAWWLMPGAMMAYEGYNISKSLGEAGVFNKNLQQSRMQGNFRQGASWNYNDTEAAATMRQRGLDAMMQGRMSARSALGGEARALHRGAL